MPAAHNPGSNVLCIGDDSGLLWTREMVLVHEGYIVRSSTSRDLLDATEFPDVDVVILCHTVAPKRAERIAQLAKACCPAARIILLSQTYAVSAPMFDSICDTLHGPQPLLREMDRIAHPLLNHA